MEEKYQNDENYLFLRWSRWVFYTILLELGLIELCKSIYTLPDEKHYLLNSTLFGK